MAAAVAVAMVDGTMEEIMDAAMASIPCPSSSSMGQSGKVYAQCHTLNLAQILILIIHYFFFE